MEPETWDPKYSSGAKDLFYFKRNRSNFSAIYTPLYYN